MASKFLRGLIGVAVLVALTAYIARPRFPDTASNHTLKTVVGLGMKLNRLVSYIGGQLGFSSINITRGFLSVLSVQNHQNVNIQIYTTTMDGVEVMVFTPVGRTDTLRPGIVFYHGGGWVLLSPVQYSALYQEVALQTQSVVVAVNYRKAPEHLYPIPLEDCLTATRYFLKNADKYGVDKNKIGVKGDSAGGNLAMAVALKLSRETGLPKLKFMSLDYPALQAFDFFLPCFRKYVDGPGFITRYLMVRYWLLYAFGNMTYLETLMNNSHLNEEMLNSVYAEYVNPNLLPKDFLLEQFKRVSNKASTEVPKELIEKITDPLFAPLMASDEDLKLLPRTYVFNAEFDILRDEGFILVERMRRLGLDVTHSYLATEEHGFLNLLALDPTVAEEVGRFARFFNETVNNN